MNQKSTPYFFQYIYFAGKEHSTIINTGFSFDYDCWLSFKINRLIATAPEVPDEIIKKILKKANVC